MKKLFSGLVAGLLLLGTTGLAHAISFVSVPTGTVGNEPWYSPGPYSWDLHFDVVSPIQVTALGAFDSGSDGIFLSEIQVAIFDRDTRSLVTPIISFTTADHGTAEGGFTYKSLSAPLVLGAGFHGAIAAAGYSGTSSAYEPFGNIVHGGAPLTAYDAGGGLLSGLGWFTYYRPVSTPMYDPALAINKTPQSQFSDTPVVAAPSFQYSRYVPGPSPVPEPGTWLLLGSGIVGLIAARKKLAQK